MPKKKFAGDTRIPHELYAALCLAPFTGAELKVTLVAIRHTIGWKRNRITLQDKIALSLFSKETGLTKEGVRKALIRLEQYNVLTCVIKGGGTRSSLWQFEDNTEKWTFPESTRVGAKSQKKSQPGLALRGEKQGKKGVKKARNGRNQISGNSSTPQPPTPVDSTGSVAATPVDHKRKEIKEIPPKERRTGARLASLIEKTFQTVLHNPEFKLDDGEVEIIQGVSDRYSIFNPEALSTSFRNFLGVQEKMDRSTIIPWSECVGATVAQHNDTKGGMKRIRLPGG